jgi:hypothetical protein
VYLLVFLFELENDVVLLELPKGKLKPLYKEPSSLYFISMRLERKEVN